MSTPVNIVIKKVNLTSEVGSEYFLNNNLFMNLDLNEEKFTLLVKFMVLINDVRGDFRNQIYQSDDRLAAEHAFGPFKFVSNDGLTGYNCFLFKEQTHLNSYLNLPSLQEFQSVRDQIHTMVGWTSEEERIVQGVAEFDIDNLNWTLTYSFNDIASLFDTAQPLTQFAQGKP